MLCGLLRGATPFQVSADGLTVYDTANNVTWLADANMAASIRFGLPLCTGNSERGTCINPSGSMNYQSASAWVQGMNLSNFLGHTNWQLPTTPLTDRTCGRIGPDGNNFGFGCTAGALAYLYNQMGLQSPSTAVPVPSNTLGPFSNVQPYLYWSASDGASASQGHATFSFATGWQGANTLPNFLYLWPMVRGKLAGTPAASGTGLQINPGGQTVYDPMTDITWLANANVAATNRFGLALCTDPLTPAMCVAVEGSMTWASAAQLVANMNSTAYLGQTKWEAPTIDSGCPGFNCVGNQNPMGNLYYNQLAFKQGMSAVAVPDSAGGQWFAGAPFKHLQPYLYWSCVGARIQDPCQGAGPAAGFEESYSFGSGFQGTDLIGNNLYATAYFVGARNQTSGPVIAEVSNAEGQSFTIAPNTWVEIKGANLAPASSSRIWRDSDFSGDQMPTQLDGVSVTVNRKSAFVYYVSPGQLNILTPPDDMPNVVDVVVTNNGVVGATYIVQVQPISPSFFVFNGGPYLAAVHALGGLIGPPNLLPGVTTTPAKPGERMLLYANGFGPTNNAVVSGLDKQSGSLPQLPLVVIGGKNAQVEFAGLVYPGEFQFNVIVPDVADGDQLITATYNGVRTQDGALITIQR
jgi:uncharacterized protein (TIGR03437 family)